MALRPWPSFSSARISSSGKLCRRTIFHHLDRRHLPRELASNGSVETHGHFGADPYRPRGGLVKKLLGVISLMTPADHWGYLIVLR